MKNKIFNKDFYSMDKLSNFIEYIKSDHFKIDPTKTLLAIVQEGTNFDHFITEEDILKEHKFNNINSEKLANIPKGIYFININS